jgi:hypothetical protein
MAKSPGRFRTMKAVIGFALAFAVCGFGPTSLGGTPPGKKAGIQGVKGTVFRIDGNKQKVSKVICHPHDLVEIDWTYPISPPFPTKAVEHSNDPAVVKGIGIHRVINVGGPIGTGKLGAFFLAEKKGQAELTFTIFHGKTETVVKCMVDVQ